jgi:TRAP-type C4-dicarboxylate transport system permease large subunit
MMTRDGRYPVAYAGAITASAAVIGPIIPPSIPMVLYALVSDASIGYLFLGGFVPGAILGIAFMVTNSIIARKRNYPIEPGEQQQHHLRQRTRQAKQTDLKR